MITLHDLSKHLSQSIGETELFRGVNRLMDPEKYVDVHVALSEFLADDVLVQEDEQMHIWKHLRSSGCSKYYHVEQEWFW